MKKILIIFGILLNFINCQKLTNSPTHNETISGIVESSDLTSWDIAQNENNPCDSAGLIHNIALEYVVNGNIIYSEIIENIADYLEEMWGISYFDAEDFIFNYPTSYFENNIFSDSSSLLYNIIDQTNYSSDARDEIKQLIATLYDTATISAGVSYEEDIKLKIVDWEENLINNSNVTDDIELSHLLHTSSIFRYSALFWNNQLNEEWDKASYAERQEKPKKVRWWKKLFVVLVDAVTFLIVNNNSPEATAVGTSISAGVGASGLANNLLNN
ncbi:MAG: hypothetical protein LC122_05320 [Chitinophagales bacterium]|nr:hypothetical protein [Chitinophagales bacterium]